MLGRRKLKIGNSKWSDTLVKMGQFLHENKWNNQKNKVNIKKIVNIKIKVIKELLLMILNLKKISFNGEILYLFRILNEVRKIVNAIRSEINI